jgi:ParB/RepB/Spo0J family partition protein
MADKKMLIDIGLIYVPDRFRKHSPESIDKMAKNLKARGQFHDIMVTTIPQDSPLRQQGFEYELVEGGLRLAGAKAAGLAQIACLVRENVSDGDKSLIMIEENETRDNLTPLDQGNSYVEAMEKNNWSQEQLASYLGKSRQYVSQYVVIAKQSDKVKEIATRVAIDISHLEIIMRLGTDEAKIAMIERCVKEDLSVKQIENLINNALAAGDNTGKAPKPFVPVCKFSASSQSLNLSAKFQRGTPKEDVLKTVGESYDKWQNEHGSGVRDNGSETAKAENKPETAPSPLVGEGGGEGTNSNISSPTPQSSASLSVNSESLASSKDDCTEAFKQQKQQARANLILQKQKLESKSDPDFEKALKTNGQKREDLIKLLDEQIKKLDEQ